MKTNKILLFLVAVGLLGGSLVAMEGRGGNKRELAIKHRNRALSYKLNGDKCLRWCYLMCLDSLEVSVEEVKGFICNKELNIREGNGIGETAIDVVAGHLPTCSFKCNTSNNFFKYCPCRQRLVELFEMLLQMGAVTKKDIKYGVKGLVGGVLRENVTYMERALDSVKVAKNAVSTLLPYILLKVVHEKDPCGFEFCKKLLSHRVLFECKDLCVIREWLSGDIIELVKCICEESKFDGGKKKFCFSNGLCGDRSSDCNHESSEKGDGVKRITYVSQAKLENLFLFGEWESPKGVVLVAKDIISVLDELNIDHKLWWRFRCVKIFELVDDLITGVSKNKEIEIQDVRERASFFIGMANQDVGQEEDEQNRGILGSVFDIRFIDGKLVRVPSKLFLSQK